MPFFFSRRRRPVSILRPFRLFDLLLEMLLDEADALLDVLPDDLFKQAEPPLELL